MKIQPILLFAISASLLVAACHKDNASQIPIKQESATPNNQSEDRGGPCADRQTYDYTQLAGTGSHSSAFQGLWMDGPLDIIANNCFIDNSELCEGTGGIHEQYFCCNEAFWISNFAPGTYPNVTPAQQDALIQFCLNWAASHANQCEIGTPHITAIDFYREAFQSKMIGFTVRYRCCGFTGTDDE